MDLEKHLFSVVTALSGDIGVRSYRHPEQLGKAADFIEREFASAGYTATRQPFLYQGNEYCNIVAELTGTVSPERMLVIGAHYDCVRTTPGADDNASGVAGLLAAARMLAPTPLRKTVRFVAFALEEYPTYRTPDMGSYRQALSLKETGAQVDGMICLEMIGYFSDRPASQSYPFSLFKLRYPSRGNYIAMVGNRKSKGFTNTMASTFRTAVALPVVTLNAPSFVVGIDFSDHWSFNRFGYNAFMITDTAFYRNPHYHSNTDTADTLDYQRMAEVVKGLSAAITQWGSPPERGGTDPRRAY